MNEMNSILESVFMAVMAMLSGAAGGV